MLTNHEREAVRVLARGVRGVQKLLVLLPFAQKFLPAQFGSALQVVFRAMGEGKTDALKDEFLEQMKRAPS